MRMGICVFTCVIVLKTKTGKYSFLLILNFEFSITIKIIVFRNLVKPVAAIHVASLFLIL